MFNDGTGWLITYLTGVDDLHLFSPDLKLDCPFHDITNYRTRMAVQSGYLFRLENDLPHIDRRDRLCSNVGFI